MADFGNDVQRTRDPIERAKQGLDPFEHAQFEREPSGVILVDGIEVACTLQCPHCNAHFISVAGSGQLRGFCTNCNAKTCGRYECCRCVAFEKRLELYEAGKLPALMSEPS